MLIVSDLHFGSLLPINVEDHIVQAAITDEDKLILISGDITTNSKKEEYERAQHGIAVAVTAGNHDMGGFVAEILHAVQGNYDKARERLVSLFRPLLQQREVIARSDDGLDSIVQHGSNLICCLRSQHRSAPRIKKSQITWASFILEGLKERPLRLILMCHHSLWQDASDHHSPIVKIERVEEFLVKYKFFAFIHGHNHRFTYQNTTTPNKGFRIYRVASPTACTKNREFEQGFVVWHPPGEAMLQLLPPALYQI